MRRMSLAPRLVGLAALLGASACQIDVAGQVAPSTRPASARPTGSPGVATSPGPTPRRTPAPGETPPPDACTRVFAYIDRNGDGQVARAEYVAGMDAITERRFPRIQGTMTSCGWPSPDPEGGFTATDADRDGTVTRAEFLARCDGPPPDLGMVMEPFEIEAGCAPRFAAGDLDADGFWSIAELNATWRQTSVMWGLAVPVPELVYFLACSPPYRHPPASWLRVFDRDRDGRVAPDEACEVLTGERVVKEVPSPYPTPSVPAEPAIAGKWTLAPATGPAPACDAPVERWELTATALQIFGPGPDPVRTYGGDGLWDGKQWVFYGAAFRADKKEPTFTGDAVVYLRLEAGGDRLVGGYRREGQQEAPIALVRVCPLTRTGAK